jgi:hypothetical protein
VSAGEMAGRVAAQMAGLASRPRGSMPMTSPLAVPSLGSLLLAFNPLLEFPEQFGVLVLELFGDLLEFRGVA